MRITSTELKRRRPKRGRPTADDASKLNTIIVAAATERFLADGYSDTSMDAIAAAAKVSKGTLYGRYPQKEMLLRAVVADRVAAWSEKSSLRDRMLGNTLEARLKHHVETIVTWAISDEVRAFDRLLNGSPEPARALYELRHRRMVKFITGEIREFTAADGQPARDPERIAVALMSSLAGWFRMETMARKVSQREAVTFAQDMVDLLLAARSTW